MIPASPAMARQITGYIIREFPDYVELADLLNLAAKTWPRFGISAADLEQLGEYEQELIRIYLES